MPQQLIAPLIDGRSVPSHSDELFEVFNPSTGMRLHQLAAGSGADVDRAVASARAAFNDGRWTDIPSLRKQVLHRWADSIEERAAELDRLDALEMGKPIGTRFCNSKAAAAFVRFYAEAVDKVSGDVYTSDNRSMVIQRRVPRGVVAAVVPWNFPSFCAVLKLAPALAAGNSVVLKPSEYSSHSALLLAQLALDAGLPSGVLNVVPGIGTTVGAALGLHMDVDLMTFTGSTAVGKLMLKYAGDSNLKVVMAECGGKSPQIVFDDGVDLDAAADAIAGFILTNQGQICSVGSRLLVQRSCEEALAGRIVEKMHGVAIGDAIDPATTFGPLVSERQRARVLRLVESATADGATLATGGTVLAYRSGFFFAPTLVRDVTPASRIAQEEVFGPVLTVTAFDDLDEAVRIANGTVYALSANVWTADLATGMKMARRIRSSVSINAVAPSGEGAGFASSHEPAGQSGMGAEGGLNGMESYLRRQMVSFSHG